MTNIDPKEARRREILDAAFQAFAEKGYDKTSVDDIVRASGLSKGTLYWYFENKQAIFIALVTHVFDDFSTVFERIVAETQDLPPAERLRCIISNSSQMMETTPELIGLYIDFFMQAWQHNEVQKTLGKIYNQYVEVISDILQRGIDAGAFHPVNVEAVARVIAGAVDGILFQQLVNLTVIDGLLHTLADMFLHGLVKIEHDV